MKLELEDKVAFVAGASRGIGFAIAGAFLDEGAKVVLTGRNSQSLKEAAGALQKKGSPEQVLSIQGDMTVPDEIKRAVEKTISTFGGIDTVVANVGGGSSRAGWDVGPEEWEEALKTNLVGSMVLAKTVLPHLIRKKSGCLIFISSIAGSEALPAPLNYSAAKSALQTAMKNLSREVGPEGVRVNAVSPGNVLFPGGSWERLLSNGRDKVERYIQSEVPLRRFGRPEEIADAVVFLASERARFVTGACLVVDGGQTRSL